MEIKSLKYFEKLPMGPYYSIGDILKDNVHPMHLILQEDIQNIDHDELEEFCVKNNIYQLIRRANNKDIEARKWFLESTICKKIASKRLLLLKESNKVIRPKPYQEVNLLNIEIDDNGLTELRNFDCSNFGITYGEFVYQVCPSLDQFNSSHWLSNLVMNETFRNNRNFKIRIDPLVEVPKKDFKPYIQLMNLYGKKLNWEELKSLRNEDFGQWLGDGLSASSIKTTDYVWRPEKDEIHFTCEEIPKFEYLDIRGSRYFHAIFDKKTGHVVHCDGAIRIYDREEMEVRENYHVRHAEVRKMGTRVKLFQIDENIDQSLFLNLAAHFLVWNEDAIRYFN